MAAIAVSLERVPLTHFTPAVREWFDAAFEGPTEVQAQAWPAIATGEHVLISAPTGSGKTLAAFLWALDRLAREPGCRRARAARASSTSRRSRRSPTTSTATCARRCAGSARDAQRRRAHRRHAAARARGDAPPPAGHPHHDARVAVPHAHQQRARDPDRRRGGDHRRDPRRRRDQARRAPRADARAARGAAGGRPRAAAHRPVRDAEPARGGRALPGRPAAHAARSSTPACASRWTCRSTCRSSRWSSPSRRAGATARPARAAIAGGEATRRSIWPAIYPEMLRLVARAPLDDRLRQQPPRRRAPRAAAQRARQRRPARGRGAARHRPRPPRLARARGAHRRRGAAEGRRAAVPRRDLVARARHRHGRRRPRAAGRVAEVRRARPAAHRPRRPQRRRHLQGPDLPEVPRRPARVRRRRASSCARARSSRRSCRATRSTCSPSRSSRSRPSADEDERASRVDDLYALVTRTHSYAELSRELLENVLDMLDGRYPSQEFAELRPRIVWDRVGGTIRARKGARQLAITNAGTIPDRGLFSVVAARRPPRRRARRGDGLRGARRARRSCSARRRGASRRSAATASSSRPRPARPGAVPFWRGDGVGRPKELGAAIGAFSRWAVDQDAADARGRLRPRPARRAQPARLPARAAGRDARRAARPHDRRRALPRRDRRLAAVRPLARSAGACTPPGGWRCRARIRDESASSPTRSGPTTGSSSTCPTPTSRRARSSSCIEPDEVEDLVVAELGASALFGARFRENAGRALLIPRAYPGKRTPLWQQRLKAQSLLEVAKRYARLPDHPRDLPRVPARRPRRPRPDGAAARRCTRASCRSSRSRRRPRRRSPPRCCSTTSRRTCTRATRPTPSAAPPRCRSTATCCASCSARRSCASSSTRARWSRSRPTCSTAPTARAPRRATRSPTCCAASAT